MKNSEGLKQTAKILQLKSAIDEEQAMHKRTGKYQDGYLDALLFVQKQLANIYGFQIAPERICKNCRFAENTAVDGIYCFVNENWKDDNDNCVMFAKKDK